MRGAALVAWFAWSAVAGEVLVSDGGGGYMAVPGAEATAYPVGAGMRLLSPVDYAPFLEVVPPGAPAHYYMWTSAHPQPHAPSDPRRNHTLQFGWNVGNGGGTVVAGEPGIAIAMEPYYVDASGNRVMEMHLQAVTTGSVIERFLSWQFNRDTSKIVGAYLRFTGLDFIGQATGESFFAIDAPDAYNPGRLHLFNGYLLGRVNGASILRQVDSTGGAWLNIARVSTADRIVVGDPLAAGVEIVGEPTFAGPITTTAPPAISEWIQVRTANGVGWIPVWR